MDVEILLHLTQASCGMHASFLGHFLHISLDFLYSLYSSRIVVEVYG